MSAPTPSTRLPTQIGRNDPPHEAQCRRCGVSCHVAVPLDGRTIVVPGMHCMYLAEDPDGRFTCTVYADRFAQAPWCHHADAAGPLGYLAQDCPYGTPDRGKVRVPEAELSRLWPLLWRSIRSWGVPAFVDQPRFLAAVHVRTGRHFRLEPMYPLPVPGDTEPFTTLRQPTDPRFTQLRVVPVDHV